MTRSKAIADPPVVRCAIYTRKSTEEGLEQEFNSLDAQREAGEAYITSQRHDGWQCLIDRFDDGGYTGGNTDRPALQRLLEAVRAGRVNVVVVYKVDRLSRSLLDFTRLMELFDEFGVAFVSVTQKFDTSSSMGRLVLNVLLSFAQFEREIIAERTRDKIRAMRRKGKWAGGLPPLGYDVEPNTSRLIVNPAEAEQVRSIFRLYEEHGSLLPVVQELASRGWTNKRCTTRKGTERGGRRFDRGNLHRLLTNVAYVGRVRHKDEIHIGEHPAILDEDLFRDVQARLSRNGTTGGAAVRNKSGAVLKGLLHCTACDCAMTPSFTTKNGRRYKYYLCSSAQKNGRSTCPAKSVPAGAIEQFVIDRIRVIGRDPELVRQTIALAREQEESRLSELTAERRRLDRERSDAEAEVRKLSNRLRDGETEAVLARLAELHERIRTASSKLQQVIADVESTRDRCIDEHEVTQALAEFDGVWESLTPNEQVRLIGLLVARVDYDGTDRSVAITLHADGIDRLLTEPATTAKRN